MKHQEQIIDRQKK